MINRGVIESIIRNEIILKGISKGSHYYNDYVFFPRNENGYRDYRYYQPVSCISRKSFKNFDIKWHREGRTNPNSLMDKCRSDQAILLWERLKGVDCLRELVILLSDADLELFRTYLLEEGYTESRLKEIGKDYYWYLNYISADFYFPEYKMIIELDSESHVEGIDRARDRLLLKNYNLPTHRFFRYDLSQYKYEPVLQVVLGSEKQDVPVYFNQLDLITDRFISTHPDLIRQLGENIEKGMREPLKSLLM